MPLFLLFTSPSTMVVAIEFFSSRSQFFQPLTYTTWYFKRLFHPSICIISFFEKATIWFTEILSGTCIKFGYASVIPSVRTKLPSSVPLSAFISDLFEGMGKMLILIFIRLKHSDSTAFIALARLWFWSSAVVNVSVVWAIELDDKIKNKTVAILRDFKIDPN